MKAEVAKEDKAPTGGIFCPFFFLLFSLSLLILSLSLLTFFSFHFPFIFLFHKVSTFRHGVWR